MMRAIGASLLCVTLAVGSGCAPRHSTSERPAVAAPEAAPLPEPLKNLTYVIDGPGKVHLKDGSWTGIGKNGPVTVTVGELWGRGDLDNDGKLNDAVITLVERRAGDPDRLYVVPVLKPDEAPDPIPGAPLDPGTTPVHITVSSRRIFVDIIAPGAGTVGSARKQTIYWIENRQTQRVAR